MAGIMSWIMNSFSSVIAPTDFDIGVDDSKSTVIESSDNMVYIQSLSTQIRVLTLNDGEHQDSTLYRLEKNYILQFRLGPSLLGKRVTIYCNYPSTDLAYQFDQTNDKGEPVFVRNQYLALPWHRDEDTKYTDETSSYCEIEVQIPGSFHYYFIYDSAEGKGPQGSGFFIVDPELRVGPGRGERLPLDCVQCQTVISKQLGPLSTWESKLRVSLESGYNAIHFTPITALGASNSAYSLCDQMKLNPIFNEGSQQVTFNDVDHIISKMRIDWKMISICDIVLNHTANETEWLHKHPECTYNCLNCPHLRPACLLDAALYRLTLDIQQGVWELKGIPRQVTSEDHLNAIRHVLYTEYLPKINIPELYLCHVGNYVTEFLNIARNRVPPIASNLESREALKITPDPQYRRLKAKIDMEIALRLYNTYRQDCYDEESRLKKCAEEFKARLEQLNHEKYEEIQGHLHAAVENCLANMRYQRIQADGPKITDVSAKNPLVPRYFTQYGSASTLPELEKQMYSPDGCFLMAHNGWVMDADPLQNFAAPESNIYLRREIIAWGDSVKLRYGEKPEDCPFLWSYMKGYVEQTARIFDGVRLDNCHSTPLAVAEYMLDAARRVRPDLYVVAELFTNSDQKDNIFVNRLGVTSLIREAMSAWDSHEEGRLVYRYGGEPVGAFRQPRVRPLTPSIAHAMFLDLTHDNPSPIDKRSVFDLLPSTALVNMAACASGSNRGYDELVPHHIHVVDETREYTEWADVEGMVMGCPRYVGFNSGIIAAKKALNDLHYRLGIDGFNQVFVDQMDGDVVAVTRHCPETHQSVVLVAFTAFSHPPENAAYEQRNIRPLRVEGVVDEVILEASLAHANARSGGSRYSNPKNYNKDNIYINGLNEYEIEIREHLQLQQSSMIEKVESNEANITQMRFKNFKPGFIVAIKVSLQNNVRPAISKLRQYITEFNDPTSYSELSKIVSNLSLADLNRILYRCDQEERDDGKGIGAYDIPGHGPLVYCGLQGIMSLLANIRPNNDLGHPLCNNLRDGNWLIEYIANRLRSEQSTSELAQWFENTMRNLKEIPRYLIPSYFDVILTGTYVLLVQQCYVLMSDFIKQGSFFVRALALGSVQCAGIVKSANLPALSPNLSPPVPPRQINDKGEPVQMFVTLSAGLPHFSVGYMRNWGRDTFISLRGLFILTGRYQDARYHILAYAQCLRHGLIPNLLDSGKNARYNCRDAIWWWLYCIQSYIKEVPNGINILNDPVSRIFPQDESPPFEPGQVDQPLYDVIQEALTVHFQGLCFRERNAGRQIDAHMADRGFNNQIGVHPDTGFVFGGNESNCGTWMDKMGSSDKAGIRGKPATPRDGSAIELVGLSYNTLVWLSEMSKAGEFPYGSVQRKHRDGSLTTWTYKQWAEKIAANFERHFWINTQPSSSEPRPDLVHRRGIYKDTHGSSQPWSDYQFRCNFPIAMVVAPEMFNPQHAWIALKKAEELLLGPLGMKTLDPKDWAYNGNYDNTNDSDDPKVAHGFNYHQGPEWVWPLGWFLRAKLYFSQENGELIKTINFTRAVLSKHLQELQTSPWRGLPELTNKDGAYCAGSSRTQAWSNACILEVLYDLQQLEEKEPIVLTSADY